MEKKKEKVKDQLLKVGLEHYLKFGSNGLSVRKVAAECKVNLGSFVYHFETKEKFIEALFDLNYSRMFARFEQGLVDIPQEKDPLLTLKHLIEIMSQFVQEEPDFIGRLILDMMSGDKTIVKMIVRYRPKHIPIMIELIQKCQKNGSVRKDISAIQIGLLAIFLGGLIHILGLLVAKNLPVPFSQLALSAILKPSFRKMRIDMLMKGITL
jgi:AcrR family transcriptional regulator